MRPGEPVEKSMEWKSEEKIQISEKFFLFWDRNGPIISFLERGNSQRITVANSSEKRH